MTNHLPAHSQEIITGSPDIVRDSLVFVRLVVSHVSVAQECPLDKDGQGAPAEQNDGQLQQIPLAPEVGPALLFHELPLGENKHIEMSMKLNGSGRSTSRKYYAII